MTQKTKAKKPAVKKQASIKQRPAIRYGVLIGISFIIIFVALSFSIKEFLPENPFKPKSTEMTRMETEIHKLGVTEEFRGYSIDEGCRDTWKGIQCSRSISYSYKDSNINFTDKAFKASIAENDWKPRYPESDDSNQYYKMTDTGHLCLLYSLENMSDFYVTIYSQSDNFCRSI